MTFYFMKDHHKVFTTFKRVHKDKSDQFNCSLRFYVDNALNALQNYCVYAMTHQTLCAHAPQQNSVIKRKIIIFLILLEH